MLRLARVLTLLLGFVALQLTLLRGGVGCPLPTAAATHVMGAAGAGPVATSGAAMHEMRDVHAAMPGMVSVESAGHEGGMAEMADHGAPCEESAAPAQCQSMAPCLTAVVLPAAPSDAPTPPTPSFVVAAVVLTPPSVTSPPDSPPPRA